LFVGGGGGGGWGGGGGGGGGVGEEKYSRHNTSDWKEGL